MKTKGVGKVATDRNRTRTVVIDVLFSFNFNSISFSDFYKASDKSAFLSLICKMNSSVGDASYLIC
jgi:hypothetical protein